MRQGVRWVSFAYCNRQPAAQSPRVRSPHQNRPDLGCQIAGSIAASGVDFKLPQRATTQAAATLISDISAKSSAYSNSAGFVRSVLPPSFRGPPVRSGENDRNDIQRCVAEPFTVLPDSRQQMSWRSCNSASSLMVPGVTIRKLCARPALCWSPDRQSVHK